MHRFRPRLSLLTALLLTTSAGMATVIALLWREVGPLRQEVRGLRAELGQLTIDDPLQAQAIAVNTWDRNEWRWRVYLPPGRKHTLFCYTGCFPPRLSRPINNNDWLELVKRGSTGFSTSGTGIEGEFTLMARLKKDDDRWIFEADPGGDIIVHTPDGDWLTTRSTNSSVAPRQQSSFPPGAPMIFLHMHESSSMRRTPTSATAEQSPDDSECGLVLWIEQQPPPTTTSIPKQ